VSLSVELIFDASCPNVAATRWHLREAFARIGLPEHWVEWDRASPTCPPYARDYASPTVLVGGRDVAGANDPVAGDGCRVYADATGALRGVPDVEVIVGALKSFPGVTA
jgi:mercuric ion transport protein